MPFKNPTIETYNQIAEAYSQSFKERPVEVKFISLFLSSLFAGAKILDVGCGNCDYFEKFEDAGICYTGIDLSESMIQVAKKQHPSGHFLLKDMTKLDFNNGSFDGIFCFYALIHIKKSEVPSVLLKFNQMLKPGGHLLLSLQEGQGETYSTSPYQPDSKLFLNLYSKSEMRRLLLQSGFSVQQSTCFSPGDGKALPYHKLLFLATKPATDQSMLITRN